MCVVFWILAGSFPYAVVYLFPLLRVFGFVWLMCFFWFFFLGELISGGRFFMISFCGFGIIGMVLGFCFVAGRTFSMPTFFFFSLLLPTAWSFSS